MISLKKMARFAAGAVLGAGSLFMVIAPGWSSASAAVSTSFVSLSYGPGGVAGHYLALDVYGQVNKDGTPVVAWESDEYQGVSGRVDPAEQFELVQVEAGASSTAASDTTPTNGYQLRWAPGGLPTNKCVEDQSTASHTWARIEPCATSAYNEAGSTYLTGSANQDFFLDRTAGNTNTLAGHGYGELETAVAAVTLTAPVAPATEDTFTSHVALNDSAYVNGGHIISWPAVSSTNEEFKFRSATS